MSLSMRLKFRYRHSLNYWRSFRWPEFLTSSTTRAILSGLIIFLGVTYIVEINSLSTKGYEIHALEQKVSGLTSAVSQLDAEVAANQSMGSIIGRLVVVKMVPVAAVSHIRTGAETMVASR